MKPYTFKAKLDHAYDGDTVWLVVDRGEGWSSKGKYRLFGVDTPEIRGVSDEEKVYGLEARDFVNMTLAANGDFVISTHKGKSKYDWLVEIFIAQDVNGQLFADESDECFVSLTDYVIESGHGVPYFGGTKQPWSERKIYQDQMRSTEG
jgi:micrococcal nuclease